MSPLDELVIRRDIEELKARYCRLLDTKQWDAFATLFVPDVAVDVSDDVSPEMGEPRFSGVERFVSQTRHFMEPGKSAHHVHSAEISIEDVDHATAIWAMSDHVMFEPGGPVPFKAMTARGFYHERYVRDGGVWKIEAIRLQRLSRSIEPLDG